MGRHPRYIWAAPVERKTRGVALLFLDPRSETLAPTMGCWVKPWGVGSFCKGQIPENTHTPGFFRRALFEDPSRVLWEIGIWGGVAKFFAANWQCLAFLQEILLLKGRSTWRKTEGSSQAANELTRICRIAPRAQDQVGKWSLMDNIILFLFVWGSVGLGSLQANMEPPQKAMLVIRTVLGRSRHRTFPRSSATLER